MHLASAAESPFPLSLLKLFFAPVFCFLFFPLLTDAGSGKQNFAEKKSQVTPKGISWVPERETQKTGEGMQRVKGRLLSAEEKTQLPIESYPALSIVSPGYRVSL